MKEMKSIFFALLICLCINSSVFATTQRASLMFKTPGGKYVVELHPVMDMTVIIHDFSNKTTKYLSANELNVFNAVLREDRSGNTSINMPAIMSTAGLLWYDNAISFFGPGAKTFIIKLKHGNILVIDVENAAVLEEVSKEILKQVDSLLASKSFNLLHSNDPRDKQTGAIACGQLKIERAISFLKDMLKDETHYYQRSGKKESTIYYVRKAAKEALESMGINVENIVTEEPMNRKK